MKKALVFLVLLVALGGLAHYLYRQQQTAALLAYGEELVRHTAQYLGPQGSVSQISNGMNCQNCHLNGGQEPWGNHYRSVAALYPLYRPRSGQVETVEKRINDCLQRSLNGQALDSASREMQAIKAYVLWVGRNQPKGKPAAAKGLEPLPLLARAASPAAGEKLYALHCATCHGANGQGSWSTKAREFVYPPLWGDSSFNTAAGLYRLGKMAPFVYHNMPQGRAVKGKALLTTEEAWDLAAFVNAQARPEKHFAGDWPNLKEKPLDLPFGPFADTLPAQQHKFGPWPRQ